MWAPHHYPTAPRMGLPRHHQRKQTEQGTTNEWGTGCNSQGMPLCFDIDVAAWAWARSPAAVAWLWAARHHPLSRPSIPLNAQGLQQGYVIAYIVYFTKSCFLDSPVLVFVPSSNYLASSLQPGMWAKSQTILGRRVGLGVGWKCEGRLKVPGM